MTLCSSFPWLYVTLQFFCHLHQNLTRIQLLLCIRTHFRIPIPPRIQHRFSTPRCRCPHSLHSTLIPITRPLLLAPAPLNGQSGITSYALHNGQLWFPPHLQRISAILYKLITYSIRHRHFGQRAPPYSRLPPNPYLSVDTSGYGF